MSDDEARPRHWPLGWLTLLAVAWAVFELTHQLALAAVLVCFKFGTEDFLTAGWLYRRDPNRGRARATFCAFAAWGLWKVALVALAMSLCFTLALVEDLNPPPAALRALRGTAIATAACFALSALLTLLGLGLAVAGGHRLWVGRLARAAGRWPPVPAGGAAKNRLGALLTTGAVAVPLAAAGLAGVLAPRALHPCAGTALLLTAPILVALVRDAVAERAGAHGAGECWPET